MFPEEVMIKSTETRAIILVPIVISLIATFFFVLGYLTAIIFGIPLSLALPLPVRLVGLLFVVSGFTFLGWLFKYRKPIDIAVSTYVTFLKVRRRARLEERSGRTEALIITGPYRYVRHPLYFALVILILGWALLLDVSFLLFSTILLLLCFNFVVAPFEEEELRAIFGEQYEQYAKKVPRMIPFTKRRKTRKPTENGYAEM